MPYDTGHVNVSCANVYREATFHSEIDTQVLLWEQVKILEQVKDFIRIESEDHYNGWVNRHQLVSSENDHPERNLKVTSPIMSFYAEPNTESQVIRDGCAGITLPEISENHDWYKVLLPDGMNAWVEKGAFAKIGSLDRKGMIQYAKRFLGVPYFWGGKSAKGFDCSGFTQFIHGMFDIKLRRDSWMQFEDGRFVTDNPLEGKPGDLMFFAENGERITHVGMCLNEGRILHARGLVRINSLKGTDPDFDDSLLKNFVGIKTFINQVS